MPSKTVLPAVLRELGEGGVSPEDITVVFALGNHRKHTEEEKRYLVGEEVYKKIRCVDSDQGADRTFGRYVIGYAGRCV